MLKQTDQSFDTIAVFYSIVRWKQLNIKLKLSISIFSIDRWNIK